jgi:hypothetical protein
MRESMGRERKKSFIECFYVGETILITCNVIKPFGNIAKIRPFHISRSLK